MNFTLEEQYESFKDTINLCGRFLLDCDDETVGYNIFEEFDGDCVSFLYEGTLQKLLDGGFITRRIFCMSIALSHLLRGFENTELWNVQAVKNAPEWYAVLYLSDKIKEQL